MAAQDAKQTRSGKNEETQKTSRERPAARELDDRQLEGVAGGSGNFGGGGGTGKVSMHDITITKHIDKSTP